MLSPTTEWQCPCGAWVPVAWSHHPHVETKSASLADLKAMRAAQEAGLTGVVPDALAAEGVVRRVWRTKESRTR
jgi:hypothetical protein